MAQVVEVSTSARRQNNPYKVRYRASKEDQDEWVGRDRIWLPALVQSTPSKALLKLPTPQPSSSSRSGGGGDANAAAWKLQALRPGLWVEAQGGDGVWYPATILEVYTGKRFTEAPVHVDYTGWGFREWVGLDRVYSKRIEEGAVLPPFVARGGGKGTGGKTSARFEAQLKAIQGVWVEVQQPYKPRWIVEDDFAHQEGRDRKFKLSASSGGDLIWGSGQYVLDPDFNEHSTTLVWHRGYEGRVAFTWVRANDKKGKGK